MSNTLSIIHLHRRTDRYDALMIQLEEQGITDYKLWEGIEDKHSRKTGICKAHKQAVQWAKDNGLPRVIISEDDIRFFGKGSWDYYLSQMPKSFDLYMSMVYVGTIDEENRIRSTCSGFTLYCVHSRFYDTFLSIPDDCHIDRHITDMHENYEFFVCPQFVCEQTGSFSDHLRSSCDYSSLLVGRKVFGRT